MLVGATDVIESPAWPEDATSITDWVAELALVANDLEAPAIRLQPAIGEVLDVLGGSGALLARMSGSGATCFAIFAEAALAQRAAETILRAHPEWWVHAGVLS